MRFVFQRNVKRAGLTLGQPSYYDSLQNNEIHLGAYWTFAPFHWTFASFRFSRADFKIHVPREALSMRVGLTENIYLYVSFKRNE